MIRIRKSRKRYSERYIERKQDKYIERKQDNYSVLLLH